MYSFSVKGANSSTNIDWKTIAPLLSTTLKDVKTSLKPMKPRPSVAMDSAMEAYHIPLGVRKL